MTCIANLWLHSLLVRALRSARQKQDCHDWEDYSGLKAPDSGVLSNSAHPINPENPASDNYLLEALRLLKILLYSNR